VEVEGPQSQTRLGKKEKKKEKRKEERCYLEVCE
jgi:hypothetical protein